MLHVATAVTLASAAFAISLGLSELLRRLCLHWGVLDHPTGDRWHRVPRPRLGGAAMFAALIIGAKGAGLPLTPPLAALIVGASFVFGWGLIDDFWPLPNRVKFLLLVTTGVIPVLFGLRFQGPAPVWEIVGTALWVTGVTNAVNWIDNMDGIAAGVAALASATLVGLSVASGNLLGAKIALVVTGAALGFLVLNFPPARIFMGDSGSGVLGYALAVTAVLVARTPAPSFPLPILACAFALAVPLVDMVLVVILRILRGHPIFAGGRDHLAHRLAARGLSEREVAALLYTLTVATGAVAIAAWRASGAAAWATLGLGSLALLCIGVLGSGTRVTRLPVRLLSVLTRMRRDTLAVASSGGGWSEGDGTLTLHDSPGQRRLTRSLSGGRRTKPIEGGRQR